MALALALALSSRLALPAALAPPLPLARRSPQQVTRRAGSAHAPLESLSVAVVGAGPSGLLLAHRLLAAGATVQLFEGRSDPRSEQAALEGRAYALGLGMRGRTAIQTVDNVLWDAIKSSGFSSDRFKLHLSPTFAVDLRTDEDNEGLEPSLLVYQTDLCRAMLEELETRYSSTGRFQPTFGAGVDVVDAVKGTLSVSEGGHKRREVGPVDLVAGCDGINSAVRAAIAKACDGFEEQRTQLPGSLKVLRFPRMPAALDPGAVHAIPGAGGSSAFIEPTAHGACALINWRDVPASSSQSEEAASVRSLGEISDAKEAFEALSERFPLLGDVLSMEAGKQFVEQSATRASTMRCNTYHYGSAVLLGDAAHSTGGASGQGCNSALQDSAALVDLLEQSGGDVAQALLAYSQLRVPEGQALLDLSLGPPEAVGPLRRGLYGLAQLKDTLLAKLKLGEPILQTQFTTSLVPFSELRRRRDFFFGDFPTQASFNQSIAQLTAAVP
eukprot:CAMPEP_0175229754 /NCGR_PEP_ID=MMETSP0093-20121207/24595_1 /TAXON_ID=311494 /ORGANISM="Alexandrium monilatum, Strain CCMP3105" /LENGTH=498 /DNA_ID=CAMNT_0016523567 /DNA_START=77 /DNA_END=1573 /DNA_ORIENTATION=-